MDNNKRQAPEGKLKYYSGAVKRDMWNLAKWLFLAVIVVRAQKQAHANTGTGQNQRQRHEQQDDP